MSKEINIDYGLVENDAETINRLTADLDASFDELVNTYEREAAAGINLKWAEELGQNLKKYRENDMTEATSEMNESATNIRTVAESVNQYSNEEK